MILEYLLKYHLQDCLAILSEKDNLGYYSIKIDFLKLFETYPDVGDKVLCSPIESLPICNQNIAKAQQNILEKDDYKDMKSKLEYSYLKCNVHARFFGLPVCPELHRTVFPKNVDLGCFLKVTGTVVRVTQAKMLEYQRKYVCMKCKYENSVEAQFENRYILKAPSKCGNNEARCKCSTFTQVNLVSRAYCKDYQEIKIQEQVNKLSIGSIPGSIWVVLENDLVDNCKPGDDVHICGTVRRRWRPSVQTKKCEVELVLQANYLEVCNAQRSEVIATAPDIKDCFTEYWQTFEACPLRGRDQILASVCPQVYGLHLVKLAVLLTVITGSDHVAESEADATLQDDKHPNRIRGQCHLLLVGDPGTGKSQLLRASSELSTRSVFTSGAGSTRAGLTCAALREEGEWQLEAGALVLSDGGVCCIDEIGQLREHDRTAIHEAMEQQTISIAKAGIVCKLNTRCAVIAACNPKGHYVTDQPLSVNVSLGTPLLSRFDLIFVLLDTKNRAWDNLVSSYILFGSVNATEKKSWTLEKLQTYIGLIGPRQTEMTTSANIILQSYYMMQRKSEYRDPSRTTVRMLDSLVRLSQAHCRLMHRTVIMTMDAIVAVSLVDLSMQDCTLNEAVDALHSTVPKYPDFEYLCTAKKILTRLNMYEIWQEELLYYGKLLQVDHRTLESEIENGSYRLFTKYDDVTDENVPLSASLITSSYFNNKRSNADTGVLNNITSKENLSKEEEIEIQDKVNNKLAATLKKHANLQKKTHTFRKPITKRKRKEVVIDTSEIKEKNLRKKSKKSVEDNVSDSEDINNTSNMLNAVPSVNDFFTELGIDLKFENDSAVAHSSTIIPNVMCSTQKEICLKENVTSSKKPSVGLHENSNVHEKNCDKLKCFQYVDKGNSPKSDQKIKESDKLKVHESIIVSPKEFNLRQNASSTKKSNVELLENINDEGREKTRDKLKLFQYVNKGNSTESKKKELDKLNVPGLITVKLENEEITKNADKVVQNSQISIFESSDCDIDLDI